MLNPFTTIAISEAEAKKPCRMAQSYMIATANMLQLEGEHRMERDVSELKKSIEMLNVPTFVMGIGIQADFGNTFNDTSKIKLFDHQKRFLSEVVKRSNSRSIAVRGELTETACRNSGFDSCISLGCPSFTISRDKNLGRTLQTRWDDVVAKVERGERLNITLTLPAYPPHVILRTKWMWKAFMDIFLPLYMEHDVHFIIQAPYDRVNLMNDKRVMDVIDKDRILHFDNVPDWLEFQEGKDLVISSRIHGGMTGIAVGTPTFVIPTDFRIMELVNAMRIPFLSLGNVFTNSTNSPKFMGLSHLLSSVDKDFGEFEALRRNRIWEYRKILNEAGLEMDGGLLEILEFPL
jgi:hypothetical protein